MGKLVRVTLKYILWKGWLPLAGWLFCSYNTGERQTPTTIQALYNKAIQLFRLPNPTDATDSMALATFQQVIDLAAKQGNVPDTMLFFTHVNKGILLEVQASYAQAIGSYLQAHRIIQRNKSWSDSLLYEVSEHTGTTYYHLNNFDSASHFLLQAEMLAQRFPRVPEKERLYNDLGVLYYENGNYLQSRNYFTHALDIINKNPERDASWVVNIQNNIAASCYKLGLYQQAISIYQTLCSQKVFTGQIFLNMGLAHKAMGNYKQALRWFHRVNAATLPRVYNELAHTHLLLNNADSAEHFLKRFEPAAQARDTKTNSIYYGMHHLYEGEVLVKEKKYEAALREIQQAIIVFSGHYNNPDPLTNPSSFTGTFTSFRLFEALHKKATTFEALYAAQHKEAHLQAALATYNSAIALLRYIEKSYDTDDAKLFLKNNNQQVYQQAVQVCLQLLALHPGAGYAQQAFVMAERNKASVMYGGLAEKSFRKLPGIDAALIHQERNIKYNIARISIRGDQTNDSAALTALANEKAAFEIQLAQVQHAIEQNSVYYQHKYNDTWPRPDSIQQYLNAQQALISFYVTGNTLLAFVITKDEFKLTRIDSFPALQQRITQWLTALQNTEGGRRFKGRPWGERIYKQLVQPVQAMARNKFEWTIIPDNMLYYLPFESLPATDEPDGKTLLETNEISYQFGARFFVTQAARAQAPQATFSTLAMAPFSQSGMQYPHPHYNYMQQLPASAKEIAGLTGRSFMGKQATKEHFLQNLQQYPVVHLATHAIADTGNSAASFIAFYPITQQPAQDALYLEELYALNMENNRLMIISACETGNGHLVNSEGVLSITRGFAYAGCASMVNSLWKADDEATAAILHQFHIYLQKGYTKSKALRQAKLDYLHSDAVNRSPDYWAHLLLTGDTRPLVKTNTAYRWLPAGGVMVTALLVGMILRKRRKKSRRS
jgi:CHAT domain-containing protein